MTFGGIHVGFVGLGDQGLPMAVAVAEAGFTLHTWDRRPEALDGLRDVPHVRHGSAGELAAASEVVGLCVSTDEDVLEVAGLLLPGLRAGSVLVNHGTGTPANAVRLTESCAAAGVHVLDAPVSGGRAAAREHRLTTMVGGPPDVAARCEPVFRSFSRHVVHLGGAGAGQTAKLFNNTLLMMNQANIAELVEIADRMGLQPRRLVEVLKLGSASSVALTLLNTMVTPETVEHLAAVEAFDMEIFDEAMRDAGVAADDVTRRASAGARELPALVKRLAP
ncbi:NAD(P)-dependent oxidoreductase [Pseudonocardia kujensis]|uniref:NAD(P)-dependent oxidoreductase n=1 Tax=Pseudonocardia kujensis TaxID=1128675 RepID=UPI0027DEE231|nr:NAD(P)-dependent oxidoreductase [Pseudonocardia kujensis]